MKHLILFLTLTLSVAAFAQDKPGAEFLRDCANLLEGKATRLEVAQKLMEGEFTKPPPPTKWDKSSDLVSSVSLLGGTVRIDFRRLRSYFPTSGAREDWLGHSVRLWFKVDPDKMMKLRIHNQRTDGQVNLSARKEDLARFVGLQDVLAKVNQDLKSGSFFKKNKALVWKNMGVRLNEENSVIDMTLFVTNEESGMPAEDAIQKMFFNELVSSQIARNGGVLFEGFEKFATDNVLDVTTALGSVTSTYQKRLHCFTGETLVSTPDGPRPISKIKVGDAVLSFEENSGLVVTNTVESIDLTEDYSYGRLVDHGINVTKEHLFYVPEEQSYQRIGNMNQSQKLLSVTGPKKCPVTRGNYEADIGRADVYNLHMESEPHNYMVNGLVVHNTKR